MMRLGSASAFTPTFWNQNSTNPLNMSRQSTLQSDPNKLLLNLHGEEEKKEETVHQQQSNKSSLFSDLVKKQYFEKKDTSPTKEGIIKIPSFASKVSIVPLESNKRTLCTLVAF